MVVRSSIAANGYVGRVTSDDAPPPSRRALRESTAPTETIVVRNRAGRRALAWVDDETVTDIPGSMIQVAGLPDAPEGMMISSVEVIVRLRSADGEEIETKRVLGHHA